MDSSQASMEGGHITDAHEPQRSVAYWCYHCNKEFMAEAEEDSGFAAVCSDCGSGFIETMETARAFPDVRRAQRRQHRRRASARDRHGSPEMEDNDISYQRQVLRLLRLLARSSRSIPYRSGEERQNSRGQRVAGQRQEQDSQEVASHRDHASEEPPAGHPQDAAGGACRQQAVLEGCDLPSQEEESPSHADTRNPLSPGHGPVLQDAVLLQEHNVDAEEEESESEAEAELLEMGDWGSVDEEDDDEWEEVEDEEVNGAVEESQYRENEEEPERRAEGTENQTEQVEGMGNEVTTGSDDASRSSRPRNLHNTLFRHLQEILRNLESHNIEVRLEVPLADTYIGNPDDYLDARGYEQLLQQLLDSDNSRRGAPPAAKSAVEGLLTIVIEQKHHEDGSDLCAICKDTIAVEEHAKQMPCLHLYHSDCILPWLSSRNSCPVCRYELATDDADYEEQKHSCSFRQSSDVTSSSLADTDINNDPSNQVNRDLDN